MTDLKELVAAAPKWGLNGKELILRAAAAQQDEEFVFGASKMQQQKADQTAFDWSTGPSLFNAFPIQERPIIPFIARGSKVPRVTRQALLERLVGHYLVLLLKGLPDVNTVKADAALRQKAMKSAMFHEAELYKQCGSKAVYCNLAARSPATQSWVIKANPNPNSAPPPNQSEAQPLSKRPCTAADHEARTAVNAQQGSVSAISAQTPSCSAAAAHADTGMQHDQLDSGAATKIAAQHLPKGCATVQQQRAAEPCAVGVGLPAVQVVAEDGRIGHTPDGAGNREHGSSPEQVHSSVKSQATECNLQVYSPPPPHVGYHSTAEGRVEHDEVGESAHEGMRAVEVAGAEQFQHAEANAGLQSHAAAVHDNCGDDTAAVASKDGIAVGVQSNGTGDQEPDRRLVCGPTEVAAPACAAPACPNGAADVLSKGSMEVGNPSAKAVHTAANDDRVETGPAVTDNAAPAGAAAGKGNTAATENAAGMASEENKGGPESAAIVALQATATAQPGQAVGATMSYQPDATSASLTVQSASMQSDDLAPAVQAQPSAAPHTKAPGARHNAAHADVNKHVHRDVTGFVKACLKPMYQDGTVSKDEYKQVVAKAVDKVLQAHPGAEDAGFLVVEGKSIRRLVKQYVGFVKAQAIALADP